jgi:hypothetical protein
MRTNKKTAKQITHENVRISVSVMKQVRDFCESKKMLLGGFFELAAAEKIERETAKSTSNEH